VDPTIDLASIYGDYVSAPLAADVYQPVKTKTLSADEERQFCEEQRAAQEREKLIHGYNMRGERWLLAASDRLDDQGTAKVVEAARDARNSTQGGDVEVLHQPWPSRAMAGGSWLGSDSPPRRNASLADGIEVPWPGADRTQLDAIAGNSSASNVGSGITTEEREQARHDILEAATVLPGLSKSSMKKLQTVPLVIKRPPQQATASDAHQNGGDPQGAAAPGLSELAVVNAASFEVPWPAPRPMDDKNAALKRFNEALDASDVNVYAHVSSSESWDTFKKGLVQRTQRVHELFRHLFSLMQKARREARRLSITKASSVLTEKQASKLDKIEKALARVHQDVRADRQRARDQLNSKGAQLLKALESQLDHGFQTIQSFKGVQVSGGFVAVED
jgi:hypothetical protein